jgi:mono/diheme cytochrome c family protein
MRRTPGAVISVMLMFAAPTGLPQQNEAKKTFPPEQITKGSALYKTHCESCHGVNMIGPPWGSDLMEFPRDNPRRFVDSVTNGRNAMPPWGDVLKPDEIQALWAYVVSGTPK